MASVKAKIGLMEIAAQPPGPFLIWDTDLKGFNVRRQFSNVITYSVIYRAHDGRQHWLKLGRASHWTPSQMREKAKSVLRMVDDGKDPAAERYALRSGATMAELMDDFVADMESHKFNGKKASTINTIKSRIKHNIRPQLGRYRVAAVTQSQVQAFMNDCSPKSAKQIVAQLGSIFTYAVQKGLRTDNPCKAIKKPPEVHKTRRLSIAEYAQLGTALSGATVPNDVFLFLALSGWRAGEVTKLKYSELYLERRMASLSDTKTGLSIRPLSSAAIEIIKRQGRSSEYVFAHKGKPVASLNRHFIRLGMSPAVTPHTLRHSLASLAADMGFSDNVIAGLLGHARSSVTSRYVHLEAALVKAADLVANETMRLMRPQRLKPKLRRGFGSA
jgi:integrase